MVAHPAAKSARKGLGQRGGKGDRPLQSLWLFWSSARSCPSRMRWPLFTIRVCMKSFWTWQRDFTSKDPNIRSEFFPKNARRLRRGPQRRRILPVTHPNDTPTASMPPRGSVAGGICRFSLRSASLHATRRTRTRVSVGSVGSVVSSLGRRPRRPSRARNANVRFFVERRGGVC